MPAIKVLYYNWVDFEDGEQRGGGVSVYQRNLINAALRRGDDVWFLSSGTHHSPLSRRPFVREVRGKVGVRKFELVNSAVLAPGQFAFGQDAASAPAMEAVFLDFLRRHGPFDVVHFNNLEGVPVSFLRVAREHDAQARVVVSAHNYFAFCPQVNLWFQERATCSDFRGGKKCANCLVRPVNVKGARRLYQTEYALGQLGIRFGTPLFRLLNGAIHGPVRAAFRAVKAALGLEVEATPGQRTEGPPKEPVTPAVLLDADTAARFAARRRLFVEAINTYADHFLAVSRRVAELAAGFGIDPAKLRTLYIGTRFAEREAPAGAGSLSRKRIKAGPLRVAYLGYMRRDKGFYFYLTALRKMPPGLARRLSLVFAAQVVDAHAYALVKRMAHRFAGVTFYDGYTHGQVPEILAGVDLGVVPVLWEDNLPQVAIECVASGVPVLTSDRGGARELLDCPALVFKAGSRADLYARLRAVLDDPDLLQSAVAGRMRLYTPDEHYDRLRREVYRGAAPAEEAAPAAAALYTTSP
ncbi:MAG TPA: glycosyltransferase [Gemmataceae bacterium]|jgi:glycosyltransferase involved in cell wall biosynthesis|nr:glycosyltransferase [Gemmataceae bacterium]